MPAKTEEGTYEIRRQNLYAACVTYMKEYSLDAPTDKKEGMDAVLPMVLGFSRGDFRSIAARVVEFQSEDEEDDPVQLGRRLYEMILAQRSGD